MREIKFRAWDKKRKIMDWVCNIDFYLQQASLFGERPKGGFRVGVDLDLGFNHIELMQYTGLKDKNGKEIYEGDILKTADSYGYNRWQYSVVKYNWAEFTLEPIKNKGEFLGVDNVGYAGNEVIGNIYENPELLKEG